MEESGSSFLDTWHHIMIIGAIVFAVLSIVVYLFHKIKVASINDYKAKYDYINSREIKNYKVAVVMLAIAVMLIINTYGMNSLTFDYVWFFVRLFMSIAGGTLVGYITFLILDYYYPTQLNKELKKWRYMPRANPKNGNKMRLLSEAEEDVHLDEGMQAEENVFSVDYDVWIDEKTGDTKIEKYPGHLEALQCNNCGFYTMRVVREEILKPPTEAEEGELVKHYECQYCGSIRATRFNVAKLEDGQAYLPKSVVTEDKTLVDLINVEIVSSSGIKKNFTFQNLGQAQNFLAEFDATQLE